MSPVSQRQLDMYDTPKELEAALQDLERANGEPVKSRFSHLRPGSAT